jgi:Lipocalin-like domain
MREFRAYSTGGFSHGKAEIMTIVHRIAALCLLGLLAPPAIAQPGKTLKQQLVGTWNQVVSEVTMPDGKKSFPFGEKPNGVLIFTDDGRFVQVHIASGIPKVAANNRSAGTADENKAVVGGSIALFGTYTVDEDKKLVIFTVKASTFPNWDGAVQPRKIVLLDAGEFINENPGGSVGGGAIAQNKYARSK